MSNYPRMLYKAGGDELHHGLKCETMIAESPEHEGLVEADGWRRTPAEAHGEKPATVETAADGELAGLRADLQAAAELVAELNERIEALTAERDELQSKLADAQAPAKPEGEKPPGQAKK